MLAAVIVMALPGAEPWAQEPFAPSTGPAAPQAPADATIEDQPVIWAVDAYPEPEFNIDLSTRPAAAAPVKQELRVVSWHLDDAIKAGMLSRPTQKKKTWRHTFGAERETAPAVRFDPVNLKADVVLLQGVRSLREVRRLFSARKWKVIASRQLLKSLDDVHTGRRSKPAEYGTTAIAIRFQKGVRVTGVRHLPELGRTAPVSHVTSAAVTREDNLADAVSEIELTNAAGRDQAQDIVDPSDRISAAGTAVRIYNGKHVRWFASVAFSRRCREAPARCPEMLALTDWMTISARARGDGAITPIVVGGQINDRSTDEADRWTWLASTSGPCAHQRFDLTPRPDAFRPDLLHESGCILAINLK